MELYVLRLWNHSYLNICVCFRYLADKFDLAGRTNLERAQADEAVDCLNDLVEARTEAVRAEDAEKTAKFMTETVPLILVEYPSSFNDIILDNHHPISRDTWRLACPAEEDSSLLETV